MTNRTEEWKNGFIAAILDGANEASRIWAPQDEFQHGWNAALVAFVKAIRMRGL